MTHGGAEPPDDRLDDHLYDAIVIGTGFGGALTAHVLGHAGLDVLLLERGDWVVRGEQNRELGSVMELGPAYSTESAYHVVRGGDAPEIGALFCVGGPSVFYGAVSSRFRERDFEICDEISHGSGARWPFGYAELEPHYERAEQLLGVAGEAGVDPTEPWRRAPFPFPPAELSPISLRMQRAATALGVTTFRLPLAIRHGATDGRPGCILCSTCDCYACSVSAKNDLATAVLGPLVASEPGVHLRANTVVTRLELDGDRVAAVHALVRTMTDGRPHYAPVRYRAREVVLAAGALATPHLLLASGLHERNPAGTNVGRYLMRHCNALVYGYFSDLPDPAVRFHKELAIHDYYFGDPDAPPLHRVGSLQQVHHPPQGLVERRLPFPLTMIPRALRTRLITGAIAHATGLLAIAEDQPRSENRVWIDASHCDAVGLPRLLIEHEYSERDHAARTALVRRARKILRAAGAKGAWAQPIKTFSHAAGTVRMGDDPATAPLDAWCRFRGVSNLRVIDASCMPTVGAVNPSLTIAALALRAATAMIA